MTEQLSSKYHRHSNTHEAYPAVDDKIGLDSPYDREKHARYDDVVHILMVKFENYQIQMGAMISDFMFSTYKLWTPKK
jgi:hypothetical protein